MKNLGKIVLFLILCINTLNATVTAKVTPNDVYMGDMTTYVLTITGTDIKKPVISDICGNKVSATSSQTSITSVNGDYKKSYSLSYQFTPKKSCNIASIGVEVDGNTQYSKSVEVNVLPRTQDLKADFTLELTSTKKELFVGEPFSLTLILKQKRGAEVVDSQFVKPEFKGFWVKSESKPERTQDSSYIKTKVIYELAPQREGSQSIDPVELKIATRVGANNWGTLIPQVRWRTYYSNTIDLSVAPLPQNTKIIGDFTITAMVEKKEVNQNEAINLTLKIVGKGNLEDIESFKPFISGINIFDEKIELGKNALTQKIVFVSEKDFTIPSFELKYFDIATKKVKTIKTQEIYIKVNGSMATKELKITRDENTKPTKAQAKETVIVEKNSYLYIVLAFIVGVLSSVLVMMYRMKKPLLKQKRLNIKDEKVLVVKLLPYKDTDEEVNALIKVLENNIYSKEKLVLDKKKLKEVLKRLGIS